MSSSSLNNPSLPHDFEAYTRPLFGDERWERYLASFGEEPPVSVRYNPLKQLLLSEGDDNLPISAPVPWCRNAFYLSERPDFTLDPLFHAGLYYVQEASSMFLDEVIRQLSSLLPPPSSILDLCAAPGGKSTLLRAALPAEATLYSNEVNRKRANILYENIRKQGYPNVIVTSCSSADYGASGQDFDIILTDVPCSGEGMFRKDPDTIGEWSLQNVMKCSKMQREIVADVWPRLKTGGLLIYSTCTFNLHENEENILWILRTLGGELLPVETKPEWNITSSLLPELQGPVYRFIPGITRGEGLFMAVIRKTDDASHSRKSSSSFQLSRAVMNPDILFPAPPQGESKGESQGEMKVKTQDKTKDKAQSKIQGKTKDKAYCLTSETEVISVPLTRVQALQYLHREAIMLPPDTPKGLVLVTYRNLPLGYAKNIGSRANNLYPQEWRIRKQL